MSRLVHLAALGTAPTFFGALATAKLAATPPMRRRAAHLGFSVSAYRRIGAAELAGAAGLVVGLQHRRLGTAATVGLVALLSGACAAHLRVEDPPRALLPAAGGAVALLTYLAMRP